MITDCELTLIGIGIGLADARSESASQASPGGRQKGQKGQKVENPRENGHRIHFGGSANKRQKVFGDREEHPEDETARLRTESVVTNVAVLATSNCGDPTVKATGN